MINKELAMEESISICKDYNIDIDTAMDLVLESSLYDYDDEAATESSLGRSMTFGHRFLSGFKRFFSFIANAIRAIIAKLTKRDKTRKIKLDKIDNSVGKYILKSSMLFVKDCVKMSDQCDQCIKDMANTIKPLFNSVKSTNEPVGDLGFTFNKHPGDLKNDINHISQRFSALNDYCKEMESKYNSDKVKLTFIDASVSDIIDKQTSDKIVDKLNVLNTDIERLDYEVGKIVSLSSLFNRGHHLRSQSFEEKKQYQLITEWNKKSSSYINDIAFVISNMKNIICGKTLRVPSVFFASNQQARNSASFNP